MLFFQLLIKTVTCYKQTKSKSLTSLLLLLINIPVYADIELFEPSKINDKNINFHWEKAISHPTDKNHFYIFNSEGIFTEIINGELSERPIIDLSNVLSKQDIKLTAISLHTNFNLKDLPGYQTFYTAHQELASKNSRFRIPEVTHQDTKFDLVVNEWRLIHDTSTVDLTTQREIIRIASPSSENIIHKIAFNPYLKPWQNDFSSLYIVLNHAPEYDHIPLYSGVILRINPEKFGLRNYTVPEKNPFKKDNKVNDEIVAYNLNNITNLLWDKANNEQWFYIEETKKNVTLKKLQSGHSFKSKPNNSLWQYQNNGKQHSIIWYEGKRFPHLLYQFITLEFFSGQWQLNSLDITNTLTTEKAILAAVPQKTLTELRLTTNHNNELVIFNTTNKTMNEIKQIGDTLSKQSKTKKQLFLSAKRKLYLLWGTIGIISFLILFFTIKKARNYDKEKMLIRKLYAKFNFVHHNETLELYKRHKEQPQETLQVSQIQSVNVLLNNEVINTIDNENNAFTEQAKKRMLQTISLEHRLKMVDNRKRIIIVEFVINKKTKHQLSLYVRRGNQRYTRTGYQESLIMLVHLCNTISEKINQHE